MLVRARDLTASMSKYLIDRIEAAPNIELVSGVEVDYVEGDSSLDAVVVRNVRSGELRKFSASAMFVFIGVQPHTDAFRDLVECDESGFVFTGADLPQEHGRPRRWTLEREPFMFETSVPGVFAAGDVRFGANRRVAAAVGDGSAAIYSVHRYLQTV
jgi:thioredoxin reductase (NADPH)